MQPEYMRSYRALFINGQQVAVAPRGTKTLGAALDWYHSGVRTECDGSAVFSPNA
ncbi:hypothetical protein SAMN03159494_03598 [Achromobacter sp. NFACC18-2]|nr:hypothetical protein SAMN03159494_03598 [Achromobacter sp. NFACC18-2]